MEACFSFMKQSKYTTLELQ